MFDFLTGKPATSHLDIRETLFGDMPLEQWLNIPALALEGEPWASFDEARRLLKTGDTHRAPAQEVYATAKGAAPEERPQSLHANDR